MLKTLLLDPAGVPLREPGTLFIVYRVLIAFLLKSNLPTWDESPEEKHNWSSSSSHWGFILREEQNKCPVMLV